jgi:hypothetical protein
MSVLAGFADADAWTHRADGMIVGRARNSSWAEQVRAGVPIDYFVELDCGYSTALVARPPERVEEGLFEPRPVWPFRPVREVNWDDIEDDDPYVKIHHRARRTKGKAIKPVKVPKYGPKASKTRTVAATILAEPVKPSDHLTHTDTDHCFVCSTRQDLTLYINNDAILKAKACDHCSPAFKLALEAAKAKA